MKPYKTKPVLKEKIWGTESWETECHDGSIPLLVKLIETWDILSVQVHPGDEYARQVEDQPNGKTELWVILDCAPDAAIVYGFNKKTDRNTLRELIDNNNIEEVLKTERVHKGDCIFIPPGTVHTLGKGMLVYEVQQQSDLTYRLYDWDRISADGSRRELHIDKALDVINFCDNKGNIANIYDYLNSQDINIVQIKKCEFFDCLFLRLREKECYLAKKCGFRTITCISGKGKIIFENEELELQKFSTCLIPAEYGENVVVASDTGAEFIISSC